jgi:hypothetical protein
MHTRRHTNQWDFGVDITIEKDGHRDISISRDHKHNGWSDTMINWSAFGTQRIEVTENFTKGMAAAIKIAKEIDTVEPKYFTVHLVGGRDPVICAGPDETFVKGAWEDNGYTDLVAAIMPGKGSN